MRLRSVAPAGAPITAGDLARWTGWAFSRASAAAALERAITARFGIAQARTVSTGRAGMTVLLQALRRLAPGERRDVIVPSYTCYSVAASIVKAGLRPRLVDISPATLDYAPAALEREDFSQVLALVATNLYGEPSDLPAWAALARDRGVFLVDDAAQSMGARVGGRWSGTWGDVGLFSFDKGKPVAAIDGGVIVTDSARVAMALDQEITALARPKRARTVADIGKVLAYAAFLRPWLYWIPDQIPQLELGRTEFTTAFPIERMDGALAALATATLSHLDDYVRARTATATALRNGLRAIDGVRTIAARPDVVSGHLRLPVLIEDGVSRERALTLLRAAGIGATRSYPAALADVPELQPWLANPGAPADGGRFVAGHVVTLPTHPFVTTGDVTRILAVLESSVARTTQPASAGPRPLGTVVCAE